MFGPNDLLVAVSQSGETADTLVAVKAARAVARASIDRLRGAVLELEMGVTAPELTVLSDERTMGALRGGFASARAGIAFAF